MHMGDRPYKCVECKLAFKKKQLLWQPKRSYHSSESTLEELTEAMVELIEAMVEELTEVHEEKEEEGVGGKEEEESAKIFGYRDTSDGQQEDNVMV